MNTLIRHYVRLVLLRAAPQDLPASAVLQKILVVLYFILAFINTSSINNLTHSIIHSIVDLSMLFLFTHILLRDKKQRVNQTFNSFIGASLVIGVVHTLGTVMFSVDQDPQNISNMARLIFFIIFVWVIVVYAHIIRHAVEVSMSAASSISLIYIVLNVMVLVSVSGLLKA